MNALLPGIIGLLISFFLFSRLMNSRRNKPAIEIEPKPQPRVALFPFYRTAHFTGRKDSLQALQDRFAQSSDSSPIQVITGPDGAGKTALAIKYTDRMADRYRFVSWVQANSVLTLKGDFAWIARELRLVEEDFTGLDEAMAEVRSWLSENGDWLLILDDMPGPILFENEPRKDGSFPSISLADLLPAHPKGHVLITSSNPDWEGIGKTLPLGDFSDEEAQRLIRKRANTAFDGQMENRAALPTNSPLALTLAAGIVEAQTLSPDESSRLFSLENGGQAPSPKETIDRLVNIAMELIPPEARHFLSFCSILAPNPIPLGWLQSAAAGDVLPGDLNATIKDADGFQALLNSAASLGLILAGDQDILLHSMVRQAIRKRVEDKSLLRFVNTGINLLVRFLPGPYQTENAWAWESLMPHALEMIDLGNGLSLETQDTATLLFQIGGYYFSRGDLERSESFYEKALAIQTGFPKRDFESEGTILRQIGYTLEFRGDPSAALEKFEEALRVFEKGLGPMHPAISATVIQAGRMYLLTGQWQEARLAFQRALSVDEQVFGPETAETAETLSHLGSCLQQMEDYEGAKKRFERALAILIRIHGQAHSEVTACLSNLSHVLVDLKETGQAAKHSKRALKIDEKLHGAVHLDVARDHNDLSYVFQSAGDLKGARIHIEKALGIQEKLQGSDHANVATLVGNHARLLEQMGDMDGSKQGYERALAIREKWYGRHSPAIAPVLIDLGELNYKRMDYESSLACFHRALTIHESHMDEDHPAVVDIRRRIRSVERVQGRLGRA